MIRERVEIEAESRLDPRLAIHQRAAVLEILARLRTSFGVILADQAGLGKSWIAISVAQEFIRQGGEVEVIVPASLLETWRREMGILGLDVPLSSHERLRRRSSIDIGATNRLVVVDEAHRFRNPATQRFGALCRLSLGAKLILVTATPFCNSLSDLETLVSLVAPDDSFRADGVSSSQEAFLSGHSEWIRPIREKTIVCRKIREVGIELPKLRKRRIEFSLGDSWSMVRDAIENLDLPILPRARTPMVKSFLATRYLSSAEALADSLNRLERFCREARRLARSGWRLERSQYRQIFGEDEEDHPVQELLFPGAWLEELGDVNGLEARLQRDASRIDAIRSMLRYADSDKADLLRAVLVESDDAVIVFCSSIATARGLFEHVSSHFRSGLLTSRRARLVANRPVSREQVLEAFSRESVRVLVMTDLGAEGLNLQVAGRVVHYDLPWNPARIAQRVGRSRRIGQRRPSVESILFVPRDVTAHRVYSILRRKEQVWTRWNMTATDDSEGAGSPSHSIEASRSCMPSRIGSRAPQVVLARKLENQKLLDTELGFLLSRRYRAGVERFLEHICSVDRVERDGEEVRRMLRRELAPLEGKAVDIIG